MDGDSTDLRDWNYDCLGSDIKDRNHVLANAKSRRVDPRFRTVENVLKSRQKNQTNGWIGGRAGGDNIEQGGKGAAQTGRPHAASP
jgi:hypothetical protein